LVCLATFLAKNSSGSMITLSTPQALVMCSTMATAF